MKPSRLPVPALIAAGFLATVAPAHAAHDAVQASPGIVYDSAPSGYALPPYSAPGGYGVPQSHAPVVYAAPHGHGPCGGPAHCGGDWPGPVLTHPPQPVQTTVQIPHTTAHPVTRTVYRPVAQASTQVYYETVMVNGVPTTVARQVPGGYKTVPVTVTETVETTTYTPASALTYDVPEALKAQYGKRIGGAITGTVPLYSATGAPVYGTLYVVKKGDTLTQIARRFYADGNARAARHIFQANHPNITSPHKIRTGQVLVVPAL